MRMLARLFLTWIIADLPCAWGQDLALPPWDEEELEALESGELVPGSSLMGQIALDLLFSDNDEPIELDPSVRDLPRHEDEVNLWEESVDPRFYKDYFRDHPSGFLIDPQELLTTHEHKDREGFLSYHARDTAIDFYFYLFDARQELPEDETVQRLIAEQFEEEGPVAVVFYFLGAPERSQIGFSKFLRESAPPEELDKVLAMSIEEALEKSDPLSQIESFSMQASIRLYWLEKVVARNRSGQTSFNGLILPEFEVIAVDEPGIMAGLRSRPALLKSLTVGGIVATAAIFGFLGRFYAERKRIYVFPDAQGSDLLGAPHAAGVGGVISYASVTLPPSSQRAEVPNYLQKM